jgi:uncharacterized membrane protein
VFFRLAKNIKKGVRMIVLYLLLGVGSLLTVIGVISSRIIAQQNTIDVTNLQGVSVMTITTGSFTVATVSAHLIFHVGGSIAVASIVAFFVFCLVLWPLLKTRTEWLDGVIASAIRRGRLDG